MLVCRPGLAHRRLTPTNSDDLLFDDVLWVENAQRDHADFVNKLRNRGVEVVELHDLLAQTMAIPAARAWLLDRKIVPNEVGLGLVDGTRAFLESLAPAELAEFLIGGLATDDLPRSSASGLRRPGAASDRRPRVPACRRCRTRSTPATRPAGCTAA